MKTKQHAVAVSSVALSLLCLGWVAVPQAFADEPDSSQAGVRVQLDHLGGFSDDGTVKVKQAMAVLDRVLNSEAFRATVINFTYDGKKQFANNERELDNQTQTDMTNEQIYAAIMAGRENYSASEDHVANLNLNIYTPPFYKKWNVVGYGNPGQPEIFMNWYYFNSFTLAEIAGNVAHEWCHKLGFDHDYQRTARRPYSVPYAVGEAVVKFATGTSDLN